MKKRNSSRLNRIILLELVCLVAVSVLVLFGIWISGRGNGEAEDTGAQPKVTSSAEVEPSPTPDMEIRPTGEAEDAEQPEVTENPLETLPPVVTQKPEEGVTAEPTDEPELTSMPEPTPTEKPTATPTPEPTPTEKPTATPTPESIPTEKPTVTPTPEPTKAPKPTDEPTPTPDALYGWVTDTNGAMDVEFIHSLKAPQSAEILKADGAVTTHYYMQTDSRWGSLPYGEGGDTIAKYACGPTSMAIVVSSLTGIKIDPVQMSNWAYENGYWYPKSGSLHSIINGTAKAFGLKSEGVGNDSKTAEKVEETLRNGGMAVALMGKGHFTKGGHFIVLRGITEDGKILVADCNSKDNTLQEWDMSLLQDEAKYASDGGPFWIIE